jgi:hypothetical protein
MQSKDIIEFVKTLPFIKHHAYLNYEKKEYVSLHYNDSFKVMIIIGNGYSKLTYFETNLSFKNKDELNKELVRLAEPTKRYNIYNL